MSTEPLTSTPSNKRDLSVNSTPSPSAEYNPTKKVKIPPSAVETEMPSSNVVTSLAIQNPDIKLIIDSVTRSINDHLAYTISEQVNKSMENMAQSVADIISASLNTRISTVEAENVRLQEQVKDLNAKISKLEQFNNTYERKLDTAEQYSRRNCLRISGVSETPDENTDDIVLKIARECDVDLSLADISRSHRVKPRAKQPTSTGNIRPRDIIVKFISYRLRSALYKKKMQLKGNDLFRGVYINEDLTQVRADLLRLARQLLRSKSILGAWSYDGRVFIKKLNGSRIHVQSKCDLQIAN